MCVKNYGGATIFTPPRKRLATSLDLLYGDVARREHTLLYEARVLAIATSMSTATARCEYGIVESCKVAQGGCLEVSHSLSRSGCYTLQLANRVTLCCNRRL